MKRVLPIFAIVSLFSSGLLKAQNGLEGIIVERYYVSDTNDVVANPDGGVLPLRSATYRIYVDMLPGYKFQAAYGVDVLPLGGNDPGDHELRIQTSSPAFFNNEDRGSTAPTYTKTQARANTVMIDSWLSVGAGCVGNFGILKSEDDGIGTVINNYVPPVLQNSDTSVGIPLTTQDGLLTGTPEAVTFVGFTPAELAVIDNTQAGNLISTWNASWASLNGSVGPDSTNKVLIAQLTTDGLFEFKLNIQIGTPSGGVENYVPDNAVGSEIVMTDLAQSFLPIPSAVTPVQASATFSIELYPNPAGNSLHLQVDPSNATHANSITIYDLPGHQVMRQEMPVISGKHNELVDVSSLKPGLYFLEVDLDGQASRRPFIKQ